MTTCVRGCVRNGHEPPCSCSLDCPPHTDHCPGCQPAEAEHGHLCRWCHRALTDRLGGREQPDGPHGLAWIWDYLQPLRDPRLTYVGGDVRTSNGWPVPIAVPVIDLSNDIRDTLASWVADTRERTGMAGPADVRVFTDRRPIGADRMIVRRCAEWLLRNVAVLEGAELTWTVGEGDDAVTHTEWPVVNAYDELGSLTSRAHALAPWRPRPTLIEGIPCRCMATALHHYGDGVLCLACRRGYTLEEYATLTKVLARRFGQDAG